MIIDTYSKKMWDQDKSAQTSSDEKVLDDFTDRLRLERYYLFGAHYATGEGQTVMILIKDLFSDEHARQIAIDNFGDYFSIVVEPLEKEAFLKLAGPYISEQVLSEMENGTGYFEYIQTYHTNYS